MLTSFQPQTLLRGILATRNAYVDSFFWIRQHRDFGLLVRRGVLTSAVNPGPSAVLYLQESTLNNPNFSTCQLPGAGLTLARGDALRQGDVRRILHQDPYRLLDHSIASRIDVRLQHLRETHFRIANELIRRVHLLVSDACCPKYW
jgi:hypothetical protein